MKKTHIILSSLLVLVALVVAFFAGQHRMINILNVEAAAKSRTLTFDKSHYSNVVSSGGNKWSYHWINRGDSDTQSTVGGGYLCCLYARYNYKTSKREYPIIAFYNTSYKFNAITKIDVSYNVYQGNNLSFDVLYLTNSSGSYTTSSVITSGLSGGNTSRSITVSNKQCYGIALKMSAYTENDTARVRVNSLKVTYTC